MDNIEIKIKSRRILRKSFKKCVSKIDQLISEEIIDKELLKMEFEMIQHKYEEMSSLDMEIWSLSIEEAEETELEAEMNLRDIYLNEFNAIKLKISKLLENNETEYSESLVEKRRNYNLPKIVFKQYDGSIKNWLGFWAQFKKIHEDNSVDTTDKIEYLIQATLPDSRARKLVESYPNMEENYMKIIDSLKSRFGRDDLQIEVFIRELLTLILQNQSSKIKMEAASLYDCIETQLRSLETLGVTSDKYAAILFPLIESCLPGELMRVWQRSSYNIEETNGSILESKLKRLLQFLKKEVENEQRIALAQTGFGLREEKLKQKPERCNENCDQFSAKWKNTPTAIGLSNVTDNYSCIFCNGKHSSVACFKAQKMNFDEKNDIIMKKRNHLVLMCPEIPANKGRKSETVNKFNKINPKEKNEENSSKNQILTNYTDKKIILQTLKLNIITENEEKSVRALLDTGSQRSFILNKTRQQLKLKPIGNISVVHCLFGGKEELINHNRYEVMLKSEKDFIYKFEAMDSEKICHNIESIPHGTWLNELTDLQIYPSDIDNNGDIEILLGADVLCKIYTGRQEKLKCGLIAIETLFGWTIMGQLSKFNVNLNYVSSLLNMQMKNASITELWELETIGIKNPTDKNTVDEQNAIILENFNNSIKRNKDGRYKVCLPWINDHPPLMTNYMVSKRRLESVLTKLNKEVNKTRYEEVFYEWLDEEIIDIVENDEINVQGHYLPHRPVIKEERLTTKIRPVFDASAHERNKPCLNDCLEKGSNLIEQIPPILLKFRENQIGLVADIKKAFLQIELNEDDRLFLKFLWEKDEKEITFRHNRVVFGLNCSPFLLGAVLKYHFQQCLEKSNNENSFYSKGTILKLMKSFYVDNLLTSVKSEDEAKKFIWEALLVMGEGCFELRSWMRNQPNIEDEIQNYPLLGLEWCVKDDTILLNKSFLDKCNAETEDVKVTKRKLLSMTQRIFDPIGFTCPTTIVPKLILQKLWESKVSWDEQLDPEVTNNFKKWSNELVALTQIKINRWIGKGSQKLKKVSIHVFCDASKNAYACALFQRIENEEQVVVSLIAAKSRVAPIKKVDQKMTIPRLELLASTIGARLYHSLKENFEDTDSLYFWSDSSTVISWIQQKEKWATFVWNRVEEIRKLTPSNRWFHLPGDLNPADLPSRGCSPNQLFLSKWWEGPSWLKLEECKWPICNFEINNEEINHEKRKTVITNTNLEEQEDLWRLRYFSKYCKTLRMIVWMFRFINNCKNKQNKIKGEISVTELENAEVFVIKKIQTESFHGINDKRLKNLNPFIEKDGVIRIKTPIFNREDNHSFRCPMILPNKHVVVYKIITEYHLKNCHAGIQTVLNLLREKFWIIAGRRTVKTIINKCVICRRFQSNHFEANSPPLPKDRVRDAAVFEVTGVDYAGPLILKTGEKAWICLFTCAVYRAIHVEIVTSMSTGAFLSVLRRFTARRGRPKTIYSDNGRNFIGADNLFQQLDWNLIQQECGIQRITWKFNPPTAAWWGGFWERMIGLLKNILKKVLGRASLNYEELLTLTCECESVVNSRPLTYLSDDITSLNPLTPNSFLREMQFGELPECDEIERSSLTRKMKKIQNLREKLKSKFRIEYMGALETRKRINSNVKLKIGQMVLIGSENTKRIEWPIGKIIEIFPGKDGEIRLVKLRTIKGLLMRPVQRLFPLECEEENDITNEKEIVNTGVIEEEENVVGIDVQMEKECMNDENIKIKDTKTRTGRVIRLPIRYR